MNGHVNWFKTGVRHGPFLTLVPFLWLTLQADAAFAKFEFLSIDEQFSRASSVVRAKLVEQYLVRLGMDVDRGEIEYTVWKFLVEGQYKWRRSPRNRPRNG